MMLSSTRLQLILPTGSSHKKSTSNKMKLFLSPFFWDNNPEESNDEANAEAEDERSVRLVKMVMLEELVSLSKWTDNMMDLSGRRRSFRSLPQEILLYPNESP